MILHVTDIQKDRLVDEVGCEWAAIKPDGVFQLIVASGMFSTTAVYDKHTKTLTITESLQHCYAVTSAALDDHLTSTWNQFSKSSNIVKSNGVLVSSKQTFLGVMHNMCYENPQLNRIATSVATWLKKEREFV